MKTNESVSMPPKKASFPKRIVGRLFGAVVGPSVAIAQVNVLHFDLPVQEMMTHKESPKVATLTNGLVITGFLSPVIAYHNIVTYSKEAVKAGNQGGPAAVKQSFEWMQLPISTFFSPSKSAREKRCEATRIDMNYHHSKPK